MYLCFCCLCLCACGVANAFAQHVHCTYSYIHISRLPDMSKVFLTFNLGFVRTLLKWNHQCHKSWYIRSLARSCTAIQVLHIYNTRNHNNAHTHTQQFAPALIIIHCRKQNNNAETKSASHISNIADCKSI